MSRGVSDFGHPVVSVIIATYNSSKNSFLEECLSSVRGQKCDFPIEIIVVDGGSTDDSIQIAQKYGARIIHNPNQTELGFHGGKNLGLSESQGTFVSMVDADNILVNSNYFTELVKPLLADPSVAMAFPMPFVPAVKRGNSAVGRYFCLRERDYWTGLTLQGGDPDKWKLISSTIAAVSNAALIRRRALESVGGWDYDTEVAVRITSSEHGNVAFVPRAVRYHVEVASLTDVWRKLGRRLDNYILHTSQKPTVQRRYKAYKSKPIDFVMDELYSPLTIGKSLKDSTYLIALPVFFIYVSLIVTRIPFLASGNEKLSH